MAVAEDFDIEASGLLEQYRERCATLGSQVRVELPDGSALIGVATDVDQAGQLVLTTEAGALTTVAAGDVIHLRTQR